MKKQNDAGNLVKLNQIRTFPSKLARAKEVAAARCESAASSRNVKPIESSEPERAMKKLVGLLL